MNAFFLTFIVWKWKTWRQNVLLAADTMKESLLACCRQKRSSTCDCIFHSSLLYFSLEDKARSTCDQVPSYCVSPNAAKLYVFISYCIFDNLTIIRIGSKYSFHFLFMKLHGNSLCCELLQSTAKWRL